MEFEFKLVQYEPLKGQRHVENTVSNLNIFQAALGLDSTWMEDFMGAPGADGIDLDHRDRSIHIERPPTSQPSCLCMR